MKSLNQLSNRPSISFRSLFINFDWIDSAFIFLLFLFIGFSILSYHLNDKPNIDFPIN